MSILEIILFIILIYKIEEYFYILLLSVLGYIKENSEV